MGCNIPLPSGRRQAYSRNPMTPIPLTNLLIKPSGADCNLRCDYCFYLEKCGLYPESARHRMDADTLQAIVEQMMVMGGLNPSFGWQGGEPTLMGLDFFRQVVDLQRRFGKIGQQVGNGFQTNGFLIDEEWAAFLAQYQFLVGLSLDGPQHVHDHYRRDRGGKGTWERVVYSAQRLRAHGAAVNCLAVVNDYSARFPEETYDFLRSEGFDFLQFIPIVEPDGAGQGAAPFSLSSEAFGDFFCRIFDRWVADFSDGLPMVSVRWFDSLLHTYVGLEAPECPMQDECGVYLCIEHNGDVYPCDFYVEPDLRLGNVHHDRLDHLLNCEKMRIFARAKRRVPGQCACCRWWRQCRGGCVKDRQKDPGDGGMNHFCSGMRRFFEHADPTFRRLAERWKQIQQEKSGPPAAKRQAEPPRQAPPSRVSPVSAARGAERPGAPGRNTPCPCGSGKKYKRCCGR